DLSILELHEGVFQVLATNGNTRLGGDDLDKRIVDFLIKKIGANVTSLQSYIVTSESTEPGIQQCNDATALSILSRTRAAAEETHIPLSTETELETPLPFLTPDFSFNYRLTRTELEELTRDIILRTRQHCLRSLADSKLEAKDLDQVILVGGQTRMPMVRQL